MIFGFFSLILLTATFASATSKEVSCEDFNVHTWEDVGLSLKACGLKKNTEIETRGYTLVDEHNTAGVEAFTCFSNTNIHFLPSNISTVFPNIIVFSAAECSIRAISKDNFRNLSSLKRLWLSMNKISVVPNDAFEDLKALEELSLRENIIKSMDGQAFAGLKNLQKVWLGGNLCINENFEMAYQLQKMAQSVTERCDRAANEEKLCRELTSLVAERAENEDSSYNTEMIKHTARTLELEESLKKEFERAHQREDEMNAEITSYIEQVEEIKKKLNQMSSGAGRQVFAFKLLLVLVICRCLV